MYSPRCTGRVGSPGAGAAFLFKSLIVAVAVIIILRVVAVAGLLKFGQTGFGLRRCFVVFAVSNRANETGTTASKTSYRPKRSRRDAPVRCARVSYGCAEQMFGAKQQVLGYGFRRLTKRPAARRIPLAL